MDLATGALSELLPKLLQLATDEYKLKKEVQEQVKSLAADLVVVQEALRKVADVPHDQLDEQVRIWACGVRKASYEMEDIVDSYLVRVDGTHEHETTAKPRLRKRFKQKMANLFDFRKQMDRHTIAGRVSDVKKQLQGLTERRDMFIVPDCVANAAATKPAMDDPRHFALRADSKLFGIDKPRVALSKMLLLDRDDSHGQERKIVSIVGQGGLGKSTLAQQVHDKFKLKFHCEAFVSVGRNPNMISIFSEILLRLDREKYTKMNVTAWQNVCLLSDEIKGYLRDKRYFVVIDDIWDIDTWNIISTALANNYLGSAIITTTRNSEVGTNIGLVYEPKELSDDDSRKLFYTRVFGTEKCPDYGSDEVHKKISEVSEQILDKCGGLPLAITTVGIVLADKAPVLWPDLYSSIGFGPEDDTQVKKTMKILSFSYYDLPVHMRACLLYLSSFPENYGIDKIKLIWAWISEGFIPVTQGSGQFELGDIYFNTLMHRSLILPGHLVKGSITSCRVHDMVLQFIRSLARKENFVDILDNLQHMPADSRRISLQNIQINKEQNRNLEAVDMSHMRSVTAIGCPSNLLPPLSDFSALRVLAVLDGNVSPQGHSYFEGLGRLLHLRCIMLSDGYSSSCKLPKDIGNLKFLQVLDIEGTAIEELPESVAHLRQLLCLCASRKTRIPAWIGELTSLQELRIWPSAKEYACFVAELRKLTELRVLVTWDDTADESVKRDMLESLAILHKIMVIDVEVHMGSLHKSSEYRGSSRIEMREAGPCLSPRLRSLSLYGFLFSRLPAWINSFHLPDLYYLVIEVEIMEQQDFDLLGGFTQLRNLILTISNDIKKDGILTWAGGAGAFQNLRSFCVNKPIKFPPGSLPRLECINLYINVTEAKRMGLEFGFVNLPSLEQVSVTIIYVAPADVDELKEALSTARLNKNRNSYVR
ncbi:unnamed protein product [Alopecurus aequalis]